MKQLSRTDISLKVWTSVVNNVGSVDNPKNTVRNVLETEISLEIASELRIVYKRVGEVLLDRIGATLNDKLNGGKYGPV